MPIYEYRCLHCQQRFEKLILNSNVQVVCPHCLHLEVEKQLSTCSLNLPSRSSSSGGGSSCSTCSSKNCGSCH